MMQLDLLVFIETFTSIADHWKSQNIQWIYGPCQKWRGFLFNLTLPVDIFDVKKSSQTQDCGK